MGQKRIGYARFTTAYRTYMMAGWRLGSWFLRFHLLCSAPGSAATCNTRDAGLRRHLRHGAALCVCVSGRGLLDVGVQLLACAWWWWCACSLAYNDIPRAHGPRARAVAKSAQTNV